MSGSSMKNRVQTDRHAEKSRGDLHSNGGRSKLRYAFYGLGALIVIVGLAYIDGGEEPLHPIVQSVSHKITTEQQS